MYGIVQVKNSSSTLADYRTHYIHCRINVLDRDEKHHLNCRNLGTFNFNSGKILRVSQLFNPHERRIAFIFEKEPTTVKVYYFWSMGFAYYGQKKFSNIASNKLTDI